VTRVVSGAQRGESERKADFLPKTGFDARGAPSGVRALKVWMTSFWGVWVVAHSYLNHSGSTQAPHLPDQPLPSHVPSVTHRTRDSTPTRQRAAMMQSGESIYNLIPQPVVMPPRPPMHVSQVRSENGAQPAGCASGYRAMAGDEPPAGRQRLSRTPPECCLDVGDRPRCAGRTLPRLSTDSDDLPFPFPSFPPPPFSVLSFFQFPGEVDPHGFDLGVSNKRGKATFGHATGTLKPKTDQFLKSHQKEPVLPPRASPPPSRAICPVVFSFSSGQKCHKTFLKERDARRTKDPSHWGNGVERGTQDPLTYWLTVIAWNGAKRTLSRRWGCARRSVSLPRSVLIPINAFFRFLRRDSLHIPRMH